MNHKNITRFTISITLSLLLTLLTACGSPSTNLQREDYNIYLNGKKVIDFKEGEVFRIDERSEEPYETYRGIKIGSSAEDVANAYAGNIAYAENRDVERTGPSKMSSQDFAQFLKKNPGFANGYMTMTATIVDNELEPNLYRVQRLLASNNGESIYHFIIGIYFIDGKVWYITFSTSDAREA